MQFNFPRLFKPKGREGLEERHVVVNPYHAVSVRPGRYPCGAAIQLEGVRFLSADAPRLPLDQCNAGQCTCRYVHHDDRRTDDDRRRNDVWGSGPSWVGQERRSTKGRRVTDV